MSYMPDPCVLYSKSFMEHLLQLLYLLFCFVTKLTYATEALTIKEATLIQQHIKKVDSLMLVIQLFMSNALLCTKSGMTIDTVYYHTSQDTQFSDLLICFLTRKAAQAYMYVYLRAAVDRMPYREVCLHTCIRKCMYKTLMKKHIYLPEE